MATAFKQVKGGAEANIATANALNNTTSPITVSITAGFGARFPQPGNGFYVHIYDSSTYPNPTDDPQYEIALCTARSTDSFTLTRSQLGTAAKTHTGTPDVRLFVTDQDVIDVQNAINNLENNALTVVTSSSTLTGDIFFKTGRPVISLGSYGVDFSGNTDNTTQLQQAINDTVAIHGILEVDYGTVAFASPVAAKGSQGFMIRGRANPSNSVTSQLRYTGGGSTTAFDLSHSNTKSPTGISLINIGLTYSSASFTGILLDLSGSNTSGDGGTIAIRDSFIGGRSSGVNASTLLKFNDSDSTDIQHTTFSGGVNGIQGPAVDNVDFSNGVVIHGECSFNSLSGTAIINPGKCWSIVGNIFEPSKTGAPNALSASLQQNFSNSVCRFEGNWCGDSSSPGNWINWGGGILIAKGNLFQTGNYLGSTDILFTNVCLAAIMEGNYHIASSSSPIKQAIDGGNFAHGSIRIGPNGFDGSIFTPFAVNMGNATSTFIDQGLGIFTSSNLTAPGNNPFRINFSTGGSTGGLQVGDGFGNSVLTAAKSGVVFGTGTTTAFKTTATSYTCLSTDEVIQVTVSGRTITLPTNTAGRHITIKLTVSGTCTVSAPSGNIDGSSTYSLSSQYQSVDLIGDGTNWNVV